MRFSVWPSPRQPYDGIVELARWAEDAGWWGLWYPDHFMPAGGDETAPLLECWGVLGSLAHATGRLRLGPLVCGNTYRHPAVLLNEAVSVDHATGGRVVLGLGAGWQENEHRAYGLALPPVRERLERLDEACAVIRGLLAEDRFSFEGRHYRLRDAPLSPGPVGPLPLLVGGGGERVTLRIAARHADEWNTWGDPGTLRHKGRVLERHCEELGRDPAGIRRSAQALLYMSDDESFLRRARSRGPGMPSIVGTPAEVRDAVAAYRDAGVDELVVPDWNLGDPVRRREVLDRFHEEVVAALGSPG